MRGKAVASRRVVPKAEVSGAVLFFLPWPSTAYRGAEIPDPSTALTGISPSLRPRYADQARDPCRRHQG